MIAGTEILLLFFKSLVIWKELLKILKKIGLMLIQSSSEFCGAFVLAEWASGFSSFLVYLNAFNFGILAPAMYIVAIWNVAPDTDDLRSFNPSLMWFIPNFVLAIITYIIHLWKRK